MVAGFRFSLLQRGMQWRNCGVAHSTLTAQCEADGGSGA